MGKAKQIKLKIIPAKMANDFIKKTHYSGKIVPNSKLHFGAFLNGQLHGVMSYGSPMDKRKVLNLVSNVKWNEFIELNRMAFDDYLPRNSESRCIAISIKMIKKNAPHIKWIISFADATQCGDGTIYRASGFRLTGISENKSLRINPVNGEYMHVIQAHHKKISKEFRTWVALKGYQLRYIYIIDKNCKLNVPEIPFKKIDELNVGMYKGKKRKIYASEPKLETGNTTSIDTGGSNPTHLLN